MRRTLSEINKKIYRAPRERLFANRGSALSIAGRRSLVQRDYYGNEERKGMRLVTLIIIVVAVLLLVQGIFQVPFLQLRNISIRGLKYIPVEQVQPFIVSELSRRRFFIFKNNNYFLLAEHKLKKRLEDVFFLNVVAIRKQFPNSLYLDVKERISAFVIQTPDGYTELDTRGATVGMIKAPQPSQSIIADERTARDSTVPFKYLETITQIKDQWEQNIVGIAIEKFRLTGDPNVITVSTDKDFLVNFDPSKDIAKQVNRLSLFLQDTSFEKPRDHIDLRFDNTLFVK